MYLHKNVDKSAEIVAIMVDLKLHMFVVFENIFTQRCDFFELAFHNTPNEDKKIEYFFLLF